MPDPLQPIDIACGPLLLRPWSAADAPAVLDATRDAQIALWNGSTIDDLAQAREWIERRNDWSEGDHASLAIADAASGALLGSVSLHQIDRQQGDAEIGYWVAPTARGRGVAVAAVTAMCRWAFDVLPIDRIELCHAVENLASGKVAARAGFTQEGRLRQSYRYGDGRKHDELLWSRLRADPPVGS